MAVGTPETNKTKIDAVTYSSNCSCNTLVQMMYPEEESGSRTM
jgi:hypothetical protein